MCTGPRMKPSVRFKRQVGLKKGKVLLLSEEMMRVVVLRYPYSFCFPMYNLLKVEL